MDPLVGREAEIERTIQAILYHNKLIETSATLLGTSALLVVTRSY